MVQHQTGEDDIKGIVIKGHPTRIGILDLDFVGDSRNLRITPCGVNGLLSCIGHPDVDPDGLSCCQVFGRFNQQKPIAAANIEYLFVTPPGDHVQHLLPDPQSTPAARSNENQECQ
jgi:hypothetical protein